jgi:hypothetical protein
VLQSPFLPIVRGRCGSPFMWNVESSRDARVRRVTDYWVVLVAINDCECGWREVGFVCARMTFWVGSVLSGGVAIKG